MGRSSGVSPALSHLIGPKLGLVAAPRRPRPQTLGPRPGPAPALHSYGAVRGGGHLGGGAMSGSNSKAATAGPASGPGGLVPGKEEKKKAGGGVLNRLKARRQAPPHSADDGTGATVTEQELLALDTIRPEHVLRLNRVTESEWRACRPRPPWAPGWSLGGLGRVAAPGAALLSGKGFRVEPHLGLAPCPPGTPALSRVPVRSAHPSSASAVPGARAPTCRLRLSPGSGWAPAPDSPSPTPPGCGPLGLGAQPCPFVYRWACASVKHVAVAFWQI